MFSLLYCFLNQFYDYLQNFFCQLQLKLLKGWPYQGQLQFMTNVLTENIALLEF